MRQATSLQALFCDGADYQAKVAMVVAHVLVTIAEVEKEGKISQIETQETEDPCPSVRSVGRKKACGENRPLSAAYKNRKAPAPC